MVLIRIGDNILCQMAISIEPTYILGGFL